jgi:glutaredoxin
MELKEIVKNHLTDEKEKERLERVKSNSKLNKVILLNNGAPQCDTIKKYLDEEGIRYIEKTLKNNQKELDKAVAITNLNMFPMVLVGKMYLVQGRDFQNEQQLVQGIQHLARPDYIDPKDNDKLIEHLKTAHYHVFNKLNALENKLNPFMTFIQNIQKEIEAEESDK